MTNKFDKSDEKLREQYEEAFFQQLMEGYEEYQGERLKREAEADNIEGPSAELIAQMEAKIAKENGRQKRQKAFIKIHRFGKYVAIFFVVTAVVFSVSFVTVDAFRTRILEFISAAHDTTVERGFQDSSTGLYAPSYLPEGFYVASYFEDQGLIQIILQGQEEEDYAIINISADRAKMLIDSEDLSESKQVVINGGLGEIGEKNEATTLFWMNKEENLMAVMTTNLGESETIKIAESINLV